ncbi:MAG: M43 family zinc metalloprotease [Bacteroidota bacterium]
MKLYFPIYILLILSFINQTLYSQEFPYKCLTPEMNKLAEEKDPGIKIRREALAEFTRQYIAQKDKSEDIYIIPVVFHVVHNNGIENISKAQIEDAIRVMNLDFRKLNPDTFSIIPEFIGIAADSRIEFRLANIDPDGNCTEGITRTQSELTIAAGENVKLIAPSWPRAMYLNLWVVRSISGNAAAYAYYPGTAGDGWDGILCTHSYVGSIGTSSTSTSRTLTHETGHYLNLPHPWGNSNDPGLAENCNIDDGIFDTPNTIGNTICNLYAESCGSLDNVQNYMDYSYCGRMFTLGQKEVMRAALNSNESDRNNLWTPTNLLATGTYDGFIEQVCSPIAEFIEIPSTGCNGLTVQYSDITYNTDTISSYYWSFPGGNPASSTEKNPAVIYYNDGIYDVSMTVTNIAGTDSKFKQDKIVIVDPNEGEAVPLIEGFESLSFPDNIIDETKNWTITTTGNYPWQRSSWTAYSGYASLRIPNFSNSDGTISSLISPNIKMDTTDNMTSMTFWLAYSKKSDDSEDRLKVYVSTDCGNIWHVRYSRGANQLSTTGGIIYTGVFTPLQTEWRQETISLGSYASSEKICIKFDCESRDGNWLYIDDINLSDYSGIGEIENTTKYNFFVYPNPFENEINISFDVIDFKSEVILVVTDLLGKQIINKSTLLSFGHYTENLEKIVGFEKGIYFIKLTVDGNTMTQKIICVE